MALISILFLILYLDLRKLYPKLYIWIFQSSLLLTGLVAYLLMVKQQAAADEVASLLLAFLLTLSLEYILVLIDSK